MRRIKEKVKEKQLSERNRKIFHYGIPGKFSYFLNGKAVNLPIKIPKFKTKEEYLADNNNEVFVEFHSKDLKWFYQFSDRIFYSKVDKSYPFFNPDLDTSSPGISAFRVYDSEENYIQVAVSRISGYDKLFQLDYYECYGSCDLKSIILCDMHDSISQIDIVYGTYNDVELEAARRICTAFRCMLIYMRPWDYSPKHKSCEISPIFQFNDDKTRYWKKLEPLTV